MAYNLTIDDGGDIVKECEILSAFELPESPPQQYTFQRLTGDASTRSYFRIQLQCGRTIILMKMPEPFVPHDSAYLQNYELFRDYGVPLAEVYSVQASKGYVFLQDLGDLTFYELYGSWTHSERAEYYTKALQYLGRIENAKPVNGLAFDEKKFLWELNYFKDHYLFGLKNAQLTAAEHEGLQEQFLTLSAELAAEVRIFSHRDYHSRNLMVSGDEVYVIDFQDARLGPITYDLASLCYDSYIQHSPEFIKLLEEFFFRRNPGNHIQKYEYPRMCLQRNLKALGTFGYQYTKMGREFYLQFVQPTIAYVTKHFEALPEYSELRKLLRQHMPELD